MTRRRGIFTAALLAIGAVLCWPVRLPSNPPSPPEQSLQVAIRPPVSIQQILERSCYDCHSNQTHWPWYAHLLPIASTVRRDVEAGRRAVNFSVWTVQMKGNPAVQAATLATACSLMEAGMMPPGYYRLLHPATTLTRAQTVEFCRWSRQVAVSASPNKP